MATAALPRFSFGKTIGDTFGVIGRNFLIMSGLSLLLYGLPSLIFSAIIFETSDRLSIGQMPGMTSYGSLIGPILIGWLVVMAFYLLVQIALTKVALADLSGERIGIGSAIAASFRHLLPVLAILLIFVVCFVLIFAALFAFSMFVIGVAVSAGSGPLAVLLGVLLFFAALFPLSFLAIVWLVPVPAHLAEGTGVIASFGRSWTLTRGNRWKLFAILAVFGLIAFFVYMAIGLASLPMMALGSGAQSFTAILPYTILQTITGAMVLVVSYSLIAAIYVNLREAKEGVLSDSVSEIFS